MRISILLACLCLAAAVKPLRPPGELWLSTRTDGLAGDGTQFNPLDASTAAKFDRIFTNQIPGCTYHLLPGDYWTKGAWFGRRGLVRGNRLVGAGMMNTTIRIDPGWKAADAGYNNGNNVAVIGSVYTGDEQGEAMGFCSVSDLTVDCNYTNILSREKERIAFGHVELAGRNTLIERVRFVGGHDGESAECFAVDLQGNGSTVRDCLLDHWAKNDGTNSKGTTFFSFGNYGTLERCQIDVSELTAKPVMYCNGMSFYRTGTSVRNCTFKGAVSNMVFSAIYADSWGFDKTAAWVVDGNHFVNVVYGVAAMFGEVEVVGAKIVNNSFLITGSPGSRLDSGALRSDASPFGIPTWTDCAFTGNTVNQSSPGHSAIRITVATTNFVHYGNAFGKGMAVSVPWGEIIIP